MDSAADSADSAEPADSADSVGSAESAIRELCRRAVTNADELASRVVEQIIRDESELAEGSEVSVADISDATAHLIRNFLLHMAEGVPPDLGAVRALGHRRAQQGVPLPALLHSFRIGFRFAWSYFVDQVAPVDTATLRALVEQADRMWLLLDDYSAELRDAYRDRTAELLRMAEAERHQHLDTLLAAGPVETSRRLQSAEALGLARRGRYLVVAAQGAGPAVRAVWASTLAGRGAGVLWRDSPDGTVGVVHAGQAPLDWAELPNRLDAEDVRLGSSAAFTSILDAARALRQARLALGSVPGAARGHHRYGQFPLGCLISASPEDALDLAVGTLHGLAGVPQAQRDALLDTLTAWFDAGGSTDGAAQALYCHRNTVRYRLRHVEELTGLQLKDPRDAAHLYLAVQTLDQYGRSELN